ncbi:YDG/SRA domain-containing protein [Nonomuraea angiospora]|uniref:YDG/SRA domain-containing protein n=1 Tax=Nonomuraea angiospora TaxID=46172 RepID=UPI00344CA638
MPAIYFEDGKELTSDISLQLLWASMGARYTWTFDGDRPRIAGLRPTVGGHIEGVPIGSWFPNRQALHHTGLHRPLRAGICGRVIQGVESIVISGGYPEDEDYGDLVIYTGHGGYANGRQVKDQELTRGNAALVTSYVNENPIRVIRGSQGDPAYSPESGFRYDGLFQIEKFWKERGHAGHNVWRYQMRLLPDADYIDSGQLSVEYEPVIAQPAGQTSPSRRAFVTQRVARSTAVAEWVKRVHHYTCQICRLQMTTPKGIYAEAAHVHPLGVPHGGPDIPSNVLCLCANHHVLFDMGAIWIADDFTVFTFQDRTLGKLHRIESHTLDPVYFSYHRRIVAARGSRDDDAAAR